VHQVRYVEGRVGEVPRRRAQRRVMKPPKGVGKWGRGGEWGPAAARTGNSQGRPYDIFEGRGRPGPSPGHAVRACRGGRAWCRSTGRGSSASQTDTGSVWGRGRGVGGKSGSPEVSRQGMCVEGPPFRRMGTSQPRHAPGATVRREVRGRGGRGLIHHRGRSIFRVTPHTNREMCGGGNRPWGRGVPPGNWAGHVAESTGAGAGATAKPMGPTPYLGHVRNRGGGGGGLCAAGRQLASGGHHGRGT